jgi:tRNA1Val (adenine37-N6)-methyltransferase
VPDRREILNADETLDDLILGNMKIIQAVNGYRFSLDAVLLTHFAELSGVSHIVDLGTGNALIPLLLAARAPELRITGVEIQPAMVERAERSIYLNGLINRIKIIQGDIKEIDRILARGIADLVLSNPPFWKIGEGYLSSNQEEAGARHELSVNLEEIVDRGAYLLSPGGRMAIIQRAERLEETLEIFRRRKLFPKRLRLIHSFLDRPASLFLLEGMKNRPGRMSILAPLVIYQKPGEYSEEIKQLYGGSL